MITIRSMDGSTYELAEDDDPVCSMCGTLVIMSGITPYSICTCQPNHETKEVPIVIKSIEFQKGVRTILIGPDKRINRYSDVVKEK